MTKLTQNIIDKIKKEEIKPKPKWYFFLMHTLLWISVVISIILGALATAIILRHSLTHEWELINHVAGGKIRAFLMMLPYFWFIFIVLIIFLASKLFCHTKKGYRIRPWVVAISSILVSILLGVVFYSIHLDKPFENGLRQHLPFYEQREHDLLKRMVAPDQGVLAGQIIEIIPQKQIIIIDFKGREWEVSVERAIYGPLINNMRVGILGEKTSRDEFNAVIIKPLRRFEGAVFHFEVR